MLGIFLLSPICCDDSVIQGHRHRRHIRRHSITGCLEVLSQGAIWSVARRKLDQLNRVRELPMTEKGPVIDSAEDTRLHLADVLYSRGVLQLTDINLFFEPEEEGNECVLAGTCSGTEAGKQERANIIHK